MEKAGSISYKFLAGPGSDQGNVTGFNFAEMEEQWQKIQDAAERRKIQNRNAQRKYRNSLKRRVDDLERQNMYRTYTTTEAGSASLITTTAPSFSMENHLKQDLSSGLEEDRSKLEHNSPPHMVPRNNNRVMEPRSKSNTPSQEICNPMNTTTTMNDWLGNKDQSNHIALLPSLNPSPDLSGTFTDQVPQDHIMHNPASYIDMSSLNDYIHANNALIKDLDDHLGSQGSNSDDNMRMHSVDSYSSHRRRSITVDSDFKAHAGNSPLHLAAIGGYYEIVSLLVDRGIDINARNDQGWTALHLAAERGQHEVVKVLLERGADIFSRI